MGKAKRDEASASPLFGRPFFFAFYRAGGPVSSFGPICSQERRWRPRTSPDPRGPTSPDTPPSRRRPSFPAIPAPWHRSPWGTAFSSPWGSSPREHIPSAAAAGPVSAFRWISPPPNRRTPHFLKLFKNVHIIYMTIFSLCIFVDIALYLW